VVTNHQLLPSIMILRNSVAALQGESDTRGKVKKSYLKMKICIGR